MTTHYCLTSPDEPVDPAEYEMTPREFNEWALRESLARTPQSLRNIAQARCKQRMQAAKVRQGELV